MAWQSVAKSGKEWQSAAKPGKEQKSVAKSVAKSEKLFKLRNHSLLN
mgnify:CR=1 FL=1